MWIATNNGEGFVSEIGRFDDIDEVEIYTDVFARGNKITFEIIDDSDSA